MKRLRRWLLSRLGFEYAMHGQTFAWSWKLYTRIWGWYLEIEAPFDQRRDFNRPAWSRKRAVPK